MNEPTVFDDAAAYERFMGRWSRAVGKTFLDWVAPPVGASWLDVGCGTGVFTQLVLDTCAPRTIVGIDPSVRQIDYARKQFAAISTDFRVADAVALPFANGTFDVVASALVLNFIVDRPAALAEMRRIGCSGGIVAAYVWDFAGGHSTLWPLTRALRHIGVDVPKTAGTDVSSITALKSLFEQAGLEENATRTIEATMRYANFEEYWQCQTPPFTPQGKVIAGLGKADRARLIDALRSEISIDADGSLSYSARANAIKARITQ